MRTAKEVLNDQGDWRDNPNGEHEIIAAMDEYADLKLEIAIKALKEISEGKGAYSRDPLKHADNVIEESKALAIDALKEMGYE